MVGAVAGAVRRAICRAVAVAVGPGRAFGVGNPGDRNHAVAVLDAQQGDALGFAPGDADVAHVGADELAAVGDQHDLVARRDRERRHDVAVARRHVDVGDARAAAAGGAVLVGRAPLAEALLRDGQEELLGGGPPGVARLAEPRQRLLLAAAGLLALAFGGLAALAAPRAGEAQVVVALLGGRRHRVQYGDGDHLVVLGKPDAAHAR